MRIFWFNLRLLPPYTFSFEIAPVTIQTTTREHTHTHTPTWEVTSTVRAGLNRKQIIYFSWEKHMTEGRKELLIEQHSHTVQEVTYKTESTWNLKSNGPSSQVWPHCNFKKKKSGHMGEKWKKNNNKAASLKHPNIYVCMRVCVWVSHRGILVLTDGSLGIVCYKSADLWPPQWVVKTTLHFP